MTTAAATTGREVAIVGVHMTAQGRQLGRSSQDLMADALFGGLADAGMDLDEVDAFGNVTFPDGNGLGVAPGNLATLLGRPLVAAIPYSGPQALLYAAALIRAGQARTVVLAHGFAQPPPGEAVAAYTTPQYEFTDWTGSFTAAQFALQARRHMHQFGTTVEQLAQAAATIRNAGAVNPEAVMFGRGPYTVDDVLAARPIADPFTLLMCALVNDGGSCVVVTSGDRARDCRHRPVWVLGGAVEQRFSTYYNVPTLDMLASRPRMVEAVRRAGVAHDEVDLLSVYDHFAIGPVMAVEAAGFCPVGDGGAFVADHCGFGDGRLPLSTHGGCQSHSHNMVPYNHTIVEVVRQFRGDVPDRCPGWADDDHTFDRSLCRRVADPRLAVVCGPMTGVFSTAVLARD
ncbi:MAG TPA: thiolase family protein [Acidimicrobiales bacterium]|nr:thiolase family protein [Acidimicrobiales bacterium]